MTTLDEVVRAVDNKEDCIVIEGDRANDVYRIVVTGKVVWLVALGAILNAVRNNYKIAEKVENSDGKVTKLVLKRK